MNLKRLWLITIAVLLCSISLSADPVEIDKIWYNLSLDTKTAEVTSGDKYYSSSVTIPSEVVYDEVVYSVTSIGEEAFSSCLSLTSVTIPESVTSIGNSAFSNCSALTSIVIPKGVTSIGDGAFFWCFGLTTVIIPEGVAYIGEGAFYFCRNLTSLNIPEGVTKIGKSTFGDCSSFTTIVIPEGVTSIDQMAFAGCSGLTSITLPKSLQNIGSSAFHGCSNLTTVYISDIEAWCNIKFSGYDSNPLDYSKNLYLNGELVTELTIPSGVTSIGNYTFSGCSSLASITIPEGVTSIGDYAFRSCSSLTSITIPESVTSIGNYAFSGCSALTSIVIPKSVTSIGNYAFSDCSSLTSVTLPASLTSIGEKVFAGYTGELVINCNIPSANGYSSGMFYGNGFTKVIIGKGVTSIGDYAFYACENLRYVVNYSDLNIQKGWSSNGYVARYAEKVFNVDEVVDGYGFKTIDGVHYLCGYMGDDTDLILPNDYHGGAYWIGDYAFSDYSNITSITIPEGVAGIGNKAFANCIGELVINCDIPSGNSAFYDNKFTKVSIGENVTSIGDYAFYNSNSLTEFIIPENSQLSSIGSEAFSYCSNLSDIILPESVTSIGNDAFYGTAWYDNQPDGIVYINNVLYNYKGVMSEGTSIDIKEGTVSVNSFYGCSNLVSITIPESVTSIGNGAFWGCSSLRLVINYSDLYIQEGSSDYGYVAYYAERVLNVDEIIDGYGFKTINNVHYLNSYIGNDTELVLPEDYHGENYQIDSEVFSGCSSITSVSIPGSVTGIGDGAFRGCGLAEITIPKSVVSIGEEAFYECSDLLWVVNYSDLDIQEGSSDYGYVAYYAERVLNVDEIIDGYGFKTINNVHYLNSYIGNDTELVLPEDYHGENYQIGSEVFSGCSSITSVSIPGRVTSIGEGAFYECSSLVAVTLSENVVSIEGGAFGWCSSLNSIMIPEESQLASIGAYAFADCNNLTTIALPKEVAYIGEGAFCGCGLTSITVAEGNAMYDSRNGCNAIVETNTNTLVVGCATTVIPESVTSIGEGAFAGCCSLKSITIPGGVESIGMFAFEGCSELTTVVFSEGVMNIGEGSFMFCSALNFISIPASVTNIGNRAFEDCCNLCDVYCYATSIPLIESETFNEFGVQNATLHVPVSALDAYKVAYLWSDFGNIVSITGVDTKMEMLGIEEENIIYDIYGRRVDNSTNGLYIVNGRKVLVK